MLISYSFFSSPFPDVSYSVFPQFFVDSFLLQVSLKGVGENHMKSMCWTCLWPRSGTSRGLQSHGYSSMRLSTCLDTKAFPFEMFKIVASHPLFIFSMTHNLSLKSVSLFCATIPSRGSRRGSTEETSSYCGGTEDLAISISQAQNSPARSSAAENHFPVHSEEG